jgi:hypothetical protein
MFGIDDPGIWIAYLMGIGCIVFAAWYGIARWNEEDDDSNNPQSPEK